MRLKNRVTSLLALLLCSVFLSASKCDRTPVTCDTLNGGCADASRFTLIPEHGDPKAQLDQIYIELGTTQTFFVSSTEPAAVVRVAKPNESELEKHGLSFAVDFFTSPSKFIIQALPDAKLGKTQIHMYLESPGRPRVDKQFTVNVVPAGSLPKPRPNAADGQKILTVQATGMSDNGSAEVYFEDGDICYLTADLPCHHAVSENSMIRIAMMNNDGAGDFLFWDGCTGEEAPASALFQSICVIQVGNTDQTVQAWFYP